MADQPPHATAPGSRRHARQPRGSRVWARAGIARWIHPKSLPFLPSVSRLDMNADGGLPVREVAAERPAFIKEIT
jgi:hypothetical protein